MKTFSLAVAVVAALPLLAFAQAAGNPIITTSPSANTYSPGTSGATLGTVTLSAPSTGTSVTVTSVPLLLSVTSGSAAGIQNCMLVNQSGTTLTTGSNVLAAPVSGSNTFNLDQPLSVVYNSPVTLSIRCNVAASGNYQFLPLSSTTNPPPVSGTAAPYLGASLLVFPTMVPGTAAEPLASVILNSSSSATNLSVASVPLSITYGNGMNSSYLSNCRLRNMGTVLNANSAGILASGNNTLAFDSSLPVTGGTQNPTALTLSCDVASSAPVGGTVAFTLTPSSIAATNASTGAAFTPATATTNGVANPESGTVTVAAAPPPSGSVPSGGTTAPGVPNTGGGATAPITYLILAVAALALVGSARVLVKNHTLSIQDE